MTEENKSGPDSYRPLMGWWIAIGAGIGITLGIILDNYVLYMSLGVAFGVVFGAIVDAQNKARAENSQRPQANSESEAAKDE